MKTIIAPTDFSAVSLNAVNYAAELAIAIGAELLLMNIIPIPITVSEVPVTETMLAEMEESTDKELESLKQKLLSRTKNKLTIRTFYDIGTVDDEIEEVCNRKKPFTVVMSTKNIEGFERFLIGSNTLSVVRNIPYPVLIVPEKYSFAGIHKIALAWDLEKHIANATINTIKEWISFFNASLHVINVDVKSDVSTNSIANPIGLQNHLSKSQPVFHFLNKEKIEDGINEVLKKEKPDILIMVPQSHNIFHKSHTKPFVLHSKVPVLTVHEQSNFN